MAVKIINNRFTLMKEREQLDYDGNDIYVIIDEFADLMVTNEKKVTPLVQRIGQLGRAAHVHLFLATQAPSREIIPAEITLNLNSQVALHCRSAIESRQIIGEQGAEDLPLYGKCIFNTPRGTQTLDVPMMPREEIKERIQFWKDQL